tara:strand:- start:137 stop:937 length:801 start_codon:yes stop_codon:yes gene_type:complete
MAAPQQMEREPPTLAPLLQGATGIKFGKAHLLPDGLVHRYFEGQGPGNRWLNGGRSRGRAGSTPVTDLEGRSIATLKFSSNNTYQGQLSAQVVLPDGRVWAQIERAKTTLIFGAAHDPTTITINGAEYATIDAKGQQYHSGRSGSLQRTDGSGSLTFEVPSCGSLQRPDTYFLVFVVCCFIPTFGISGFAALCCADKISGVMKLPSVEGAPSLKITQPTDAYLTTVEVDFAKYAGLDERAKLDLVLMVACYVCTQHTEEGSGGNNL